MKWIKKGRIYNYEGDFSWAKHSFSKPAPFLRNEGTLRIYGGFRDHLGVSRIGFIDVDPDDLNKVIRVSERPLIDIGIPGSFDDNGVVPTAVIKKNDMIYLYYEGYQLAHKVKFLSYTGLAISSDDGETFTKYSQTPVMERSDSELLVRAIHSIIIEKDIWRVWYTAGSKFVNIGSTEHPNYNINYCESLNGLSFPKEGNICIDIEEGEYRVGKPFVFKKDTLYHMFFSYAGFIQPYRIGYAISQDGFHWERKADEVIKPSDKGWDSQMICYPYVFKLKDKWIMFYNGNNYGETGLGYAQLDD